MQKTLKKWQMLLVLLLVTSTVAIPVRASAEIIPPSQVIYGMTYGDWSAAWWQWALQLSNTKSPLFDDTGAKCASGQGVGPVFFLVGGGTTANTLVRNDCIVPAGKALFFPIINGECSTAEKDTVFYAASDWALRVCASKLLDGIDISSLLVTVDGVTLQGEQLKAFRAQSPVFHFTDIPKDNFLTPAPGKKFVTASSGTSVSDGFWVMLDPLSVGTHTIHFQGTITSGPSPFGLNVTYNLTVQ